MIFSQWSRAYKGAESVNTDESCYNIDEALFLYYHSACVLPKTFQVRISSSFKSDIKWT